MRLERFQWIVSYDYLRKNYRLSRETGCDGGWQVSNRTVSRQAREIKILLPELVEGYSE